MNIHEYQAKEVLGRFGVAVPRGRVAFTAEEAEAAAKELGTAVTVVKAQIHAGGRGKGGGVKIAKSSAEAKELARTMIGMRLVTHQTGPEGKKVRKVWVEEGSKIARELYLGIVLDRGRGRNVVMASTEGGVEIEKVAAETPEKILKEVVDPAVGLLPFQARKLAFGLGLTGDAFKSGVQFIQALYKAFDALDCSIAEINPLVVTEDQRVIALDAKLNFDDNALYRHKDVAALRDTDEEDPRETQAKEHGLSYVALDGNIGCMVNGAGLAMATMDMIKYCGGEPANFLDVGGGASEETVTEAFKIILADPNVKGILVNIFGGIMKCDVIAAGVVAAAKQVDLKVPLVVRLEGTNVERGREILAASGLKIASASDMRDAAEKVVAATRA